MKTFKAMLVYQKGIANVFEVESFNLEDYGREAKRLMQGSFVSCIGYAQGLAYAGYIVRSAICNHAGDIIKATWSENFESAPFADTLWNMRIN
jgi:hypothetical protein